MGLCTNIDDVVVDDVVEGLCLGPLCQMLIVDVFELISFGMITYALLRAYALLLAWIGTVEGLCLGSLFKEKC